jgi:hypothetical protein
MNGVEDRTLDVFILCRIPSWLTDEGLHDFAVCGAMANANSVDRVIGGRYSPSLHLKGFKTAPITGLLMIHFGAGFALCCSNLFAEGTA